MGMNNSRIEYRGFYISKMTGFVWTAGKHYEQFIFNGGSVKRAKELIDIALGVLEKNI